MPQALEEILNGQHTGQDGGDLPEPLFFPLLFPSFFFPALMIKWLTGA